MIMAGLVCDPYAW